MPQSRWYNMTMLVLSLLPLLSLSCFAAATNSNSNQDALWTLPLVSHRQQIERRRLAGMNVEEFAFQEDDRRRRNNRNRRRLGSSRMAVEGGALQVGALYQGYGTHYVDLWVGSPPQRQTLIVDTGSGVSAFPCSGCGDCGSGKHIDEFFQESQSTTFTKVPCGLCKRGRCNSIGKSSNPEDECRIGMSYQEGSSWNAFEATDSVYIGGPHHFGLLHDNGGKSDLDPNHAKAFSFNMTFGCQTHLTGLFKTQLADGIMGMDNANTAFWAQAHAARILPTQTFALCFSRQPTAKRSGTESGAVTLGGYDARLHQTPLVYTSNKQYKGGFFAVHVRKVYLRQGGGGDSSTSSSKDAKVVQLQVDENSLNYGNVIVDSGTTDTYFTKRISGQFRKVYEEMTGLKYHHRGVDLTDEQLNNLPTILVQMAGDVSTNTKLFSKDPTKVVGLAGVVDPDHPYDVLLAIPPSHYMEWDDKTRKYVARFYDDEGRGSVLGANAMMGHDVFFDVDAQRIGWSESDCDYTSLVNDNGFLFSADGHLETEQRQQDKATTDNNKDKNGDTPAPDTESNDDVVEVVDAEEKDDDDDANDDDDDDNVIGTKVGGTEDHYVLQNTMNGCTDWGCRGVAIASLLAFMVAGVLVGQGCASSSSSSSRALYSKANNNEDEVMFDGDFGRGEEDDHVEFASRFRDEPDDDDHDDDDNAGPPSLL